MQEEVYPFQTLISTASSFRLHSHPIRPLLPSMTQLPLYSWISCYATGNGDSPAISCDRQTTTSSLFQTKKATLRSFQNALRGSVSRKFFFPLSFQNTGLSLFVGWGQDSHKLTKCWRHLKADLTISKIVMLTLPLEYPLKRLLD